ncbi:hypothetical protein CEXT_457411 [Caerostris extrusa]|uniref:Uncharacterized protein n=1 Tax=Caerostris extrusa TaxID=172846 RepID=A0AAV4VIY5_CAEEX|nr:hypothetical protein CEXT_457411 [Caerostris extrusa]
MLSFLFPVAIMPIHSKRSDGLRDKLLRDRKLIFISFNPGPQSPFILMPLLISFLNYRCDGQKQSILSPAPSMKINLMDLTKLARRTHSAGHSLYSILRPDQSWGSPTGLTVHCDGMGRGSSQ